MGEKSNISTIIEHFQRTPIVELTDLELEKDLILFGSYVSIVKNKILNQVSMTIELLNDKILQEQFCDFFACDDFKAGLSIIFSNNPKLVKSKAIKENIKRWKKIDIRQR